MAIARLVQLAVALGCAVALLLIRLFWRRRSLLRHLPVPVSTCTYAGLAGQARSLNSPNRVRVQEGGSRIWGHEKVVFQNEAGVMYTRWANDLGAAFKLKSAWLVRSISHSSFLRLLTRSPLSASRFVGHCRSPRSWPHLHKGLSL